MSWVNKVKKYESFSQLMGINKLTNVKFYMSKNLPDNIVQ